MTGVAITINDASDADTILSVKRRVFFANRTLFVRRQRLVYSEGPRGMDALADDETLGGVGVVQDGSAKLDVLVADLSEADLSELGAELIAAVVFDSVGEALAALAEGADIEWTVPTGIRGRTPLFIAASHGHANVLRALIDCGADKEAKNEHGKSALFICAYFGRTECLRVLLQSGADKNACDDAGETPLMATCRYGFNAYVQLLLDADAHREVINHQGQTARMLIDQQADLSPSQRTRLLDLFER
jgi:hypothetical protein